MNWPLSDVKAHYDRLKIPVPVEKAECVRCGAQYLPTGSCSNRTCQGGRGESEYKPAPKRNKMGNVWTEYDGVRYQSKLEAEVAMRLDLMVKAKQILGYRRQVVCALSVSGVEICKHIVDFLVQNLDGSVEVWEAKGHATAIWKLKKKLFEAQYPDIKYTVVTK